MKVQSAHPAGEVLGQEDSHKRLSQGSLRFLFLSLSLTLEMLLSALPGCRHHHGH